MKIDLDRWDGMYKTNETGWDIGYASPAITKFFDSLDDKSINILIPGGGNSYEAEELYKQGFTNVEVVDIAPTALANLKDRIPDFPKSQLHCKNFFEFNGQYDFIVEQTFFCAIDRELRPAYVEHTAKLLKDEGKIVGLLWNKEKRHDRPPYGGSESEYRELFSPYFEIKIMEDCNNSIKPRRGHELFVLLEKKSTQA